MGSKIRNFEIYLFYCIVLLPWPKAHHTPPPCNKDSSRLVRKIVRAKWIPILDKFLVKLPPECPLHPARDIFAPRQDAKKRDRPTQWTCRLCGKSFYQEKFLDLHFEKRHNTCINNAEDARCFGELCDIFRCDVYLTDESSSLKTNDQKIVTDIEVWGDSFGQNSALAKANVAYLSLLPLRTSSIGASRAAKVQNRQLCQDKIGQTNCQQTETSNENYIYNNNNGASRTKFMPQTPAESLTSSAAPHIYSSASSSSAARLHKAPSSSASSSSSSYGSSASTATSGGSSSTTTTSSTTATTKEPNTRSDSHVDHNTRDASNAKESTNDSVKVSGNTSDNDSNQIFGTNGQQTTMQKRKANCNPEEMSILRAKCENLLRTCIGSLIHEMTEQNFRDMEEEMDKAVCWYLTCDRYWEDGPLEPRAFPWGLILILVFVLSSGVCFCYYIIWILFDSEETTINATANHHYYPQQRQHHQEPPPEYRQHQHMYIPASHQQQQQQQQQHQQQHHQSLMEDPYHFQEYPTTGIHRHGMTNADHPSSSNQYYYQQPPQQGAESTHPHDLYPEPVQYEYRHSPRRYIGDPRRPGTPTITMATGVIGGAAAGGGGQTPLRHPQTNLAYQQDILDRRDYISSRPIATTVVSSHNTLASTRGPNTGSSGALSSLSHHSAQLDCDNTLPATHLGSSSSSAAGVGGGGVKHYNTIPRPLEPRQRYVSGSQQSLRASSSTHEIIQNEVGHNEHYIYVTYPPDLKKRFFEKYE